MPGERGMMGNWDSEEQCTLSHLQNHVSSKYLSILFGDSIHLLTSYIVNIFSVSRMSLVLPPIHLHFKFYLLDTCNLAVFTIPLLSPCSNCDSPQLIESLKGKKVVEVACGASHSGCILDDGTLYTWGKGRYGRLGHNDHEPQYRPKQVSIFLSIYSLRYMHMSPSILRGL